jgi:threonylcarbamoyladenosine tRNA methylthiotransferase MtaB
VDGNIVKARAKRLREEGAAVKAAHLASRVGDVDTALFEENGNGRLPDFSLVRVDNPPPAGSLGIVTVVSAADDHLIGTLHG